MQCKFLMKFFAILALLVLTACQPKTGTMLQVQLLWQGQPLDCQRSFELGGQSWQLQQLQFYLSSFSQQQQQVFLQPNRNQSAELALLGTDCHAPGHWQLAFASPLVNAPLQFELGVPFMLNHQNPLTAEVPLQQLDMHWAWQSGYKFFRLDLKGPQSDWSFHLGSSGCSSPSVMRAPTQPCTAPNRVQVQLPYNGQTTLTLDLALLLRDFRPSTNNSCMADPASISCQQLMPAIGVGRQTTLWALQP